MPTTQGPGTGYGASAGAGAEDLNYGQRGYRRMKLAAMAGNLYRSGQQAVTDIKEQYAQTRGLDSGHDGYGRTHIPGAFPDVAIKVQGNDQMVLFPSYAKRHVKKDWSKEPQHQPQNEEGGTNEEYWRQEWEKNEDAKAVVDVDVRGWLYSPQVGPMNKRNRMLIGLARQLSGLAPPKSQQQGYETAEGGGLRAQHEAREAQREQERIKQEAAQIERRGQQEKKVAYHGGYSERPEANSSETGSMYNYHAQPGSDIGSAPGSPTRSATQYSTATAATEMTESELTMANANLMARIAPFMTNPMVALPVTVFFYNDNQSQSRTIITNDAGHFILRAALEFVPTHVRVLANENLSAIQEVQITEPDGVSLISDVDDTIKRSNISAGAKEIFRNTFVRELGEMTVDGVKEWYNEMYDLNVSFHYCSNSPWQLYPVLATYFKLVGLPPGSLHLKQYAGMLQGIFEPVAERKKTTLDRLLRDFPQRKFLLVGDSGEADLEVYTELALANPGRILAIFIRDVTTPIKTGFFENSYNGLRKQASNLSLNNSRPPMNRAPQTTATAPPRREEKPPAGPAMGDLIDFSEEPEQAKLDDTAALKQVRNQAPYKSGSALELLSAKKPPPPRPLKPAALRSTPSLVEPNGSNRSPSQDETPPPLPTRRAVGGGNALHPLSQIQGATQQTAASSRSSTPGSSSGQTGRAPNERFPPAPPPPRRRGTPSSLRSNANSDVDYDPLPSALTHTTSRSTTRSRGASPPNSPPLGPQQQQALDRKVELWNRRLERAHEQLDQLGVMLYTWRKGQDVSQEAMGIVKSANRKMERKGKDTRQLERAARRGQ